MERITDISEPQVPTKEQKDQLIKFSISSFRCHWEKLFFSQWNWI